ncbi:MAG: lectin-like protein [Oscillospiraceae bacterium]|nr:lectin-like protein [Oscillospiraceae bacterium]
MSNLRKICPNCGRYYTLNDVFCESCGSKLVREEIKEQPVEQPVQRPFDQPVDYRSEIPFPIENPAVNKEKGTGVLVAVVIILASVLLVGIAVLILLLVRDDDKYNSEINYSMDAVNTSQSDDLDAFENNKETSSAALETVEATTVSTIPPTEPTTDPPAETTKPEPKKEFIVISEACSWTEAKSRCEEMGGHLAYITCDEDFNEILSQLSKTQLKYVWLGGRSYISDDGTVTAEWLNGDDFSYIEREGLWFGSEPSGRDYTSDGQPLEPYIMMWQVKDKWSLNDNSDLALSCYRKERIGFICEIDS